MRKIQSLWDVVRYDIPRFILNVWRYRGWLWRNREWDSICMIDLMERKFRLMADVFDHGNHLSAPRSAKQVRVCAELCRRMKADEYFENVAANVTYEHSWDVTELGTSTLTIRTFKDGVELDWPTLKRYHEAADRNKKNDLNYLTTLMRRHLFTWWD
jgi:hypothetical protein